MDKNRRELEGGVKVEQKGHVDERISRARRISPTIYFARERLFFVCLFVLAATCIV